MVPEVAQFPEVVVAEHGGGAPVVQGALRAARPPQGRPHGQVIYVGWGLRMEDLHLKNQLIAEKKLEALPFRLTCRLVALLDLLGVALHQELIEGRVT